MNRVETSPKALLEMRGIHKSFGGVEVVHGVDFDVRAGEIHARCGENGASKSTLMNVLGGVILFKVSRRQLATFDNFTCE